MPDRTLTESDVRRLLDPSTLILAIEAAFRDRYPSIVLPNRTIARLAHGTLLVMSCYDAAGHALGMKLVMVRDRAIGKAFDQTRVQATYLLLDPETAQPQLSIAAKYLTDLRTAATSAVATKFLARPDVRTLGIFGTGRLARAHLQVLPLVRTFDRVLVCGRSPDRSSEFAQELSSEMPQLSIIASDPRTCAAQSDVLCTCTSNSTPLFDGHDLRRGTHLNLVGGFQPHVREVDTHTMRSARVVVDTYDAAESEVGELLIPQKEGAIGANHVAADLHELVSGKKRERLSGDEISIFKSVGCALEDLVAAELLLQAEIKTT